DRQAAFEIGRISLPVLELSLWRGIQGVDERLVFALIHRAIDVRRLVAARAFLVVARLAPRDAEVDGVGVDDGRNRIEESEAVFAGRIADRVRQSGGGQGSGAKDNTVVVLGTRSMTGIQGIAKRIVCPWVPDRAARVRDDAVKKFANRLNLFPSHLD